ncbi:MAG TPA: DinB family protein [Streptosporangiaceae bacterium]
MTWTAPEVTRTEAPRVAGERAALDTWLDYHRETLLFKCQGLTGEQLVQRAMPPSGLTLLGLVRHMAEVERWWFRRQFDGQADAVDMYITEEMPDGEFDLVEAAGAEENLATFRQECELSRKTAAGRSLDETFTSTWEKEFDLRWVYIHMIEEYARHNGHADILREQIDGVTGD